jgi:hypothetical protein
VENTISANSIVVACKDQVSCELEGEAAILDLKSGTYFGLNPVGAIVWSMIAEPRRVTEICDALLNRYDVAAEQCDREVVELLGELRAQGLIRVEG